MNNEAMVQQETEAQILSPKFDLSEQSDFYQLMTHIRNMIECYGPHITDEFKDHLNTSDLNYHFRIRQIIQHYGEEAVRDFFIKVYGWKFESNKIVDEPVALQCGA